MTSKKSGTAWTGKSSWEWKKLMKEETQGYLQENEETNEEPGEPVKKEMNRWFTVSRVRVSGLRGEKNDVWDLSIWNTKFVIQIPYRGFTQPTSKEILRRGVVYRKFVGCTNKIFVDLESFRFVENWYRLCRREKGFRSGR